MDQFNALALLAALLTLLPPEYGLPMDEAELDRIDMCHVKYTTLTGKQKFLSPITDPSRILDLGCGTGVTYL
jgi:hypothetical protein